jgi:hypothetical protein
MGAGRKKTLRKMPSVPEHRPIGEVIYPKLYREIPGIAVIDVEETERKEAVAKVMEAGEAVGLREKLGKLLACVVGPVCVSRQEKTRLATTATGKRGRVQAKKEVFKPLLSFRSCLVD